MTCSRGSSRTGTNPHVFDERRTFREAAPPLAGPRDVPGPRLPTEPSPPAHVAVDRGPLARARAGPVVGDHARRPQPRRAVGGHRRAARRSVGNSIDDVFAGKSEPAHGDYL